MTSGALKLRNKIQEGRNWRETVSLRIDDEKIEIKVRQLEDPEFWKVKEKINEDKMEEIGNNIDQEKVNKYDELSEKEELTDQEKQEFDKLETQIENEILSAINDFDMDTFEGIVDAGKYGVVIDQESIDEVGSMTPAEQKDMFGETFKNGEEIRKFLKDDLQHQIEHATNLVSFLLGMTVLDATTEDEGK